MPTTSKTFDLYQAAVDASKLVASRRARRNAKSRMVGVRAHFLVKRRPLPAFMIIGTMRGGTSSLFKYLESHPDTAASLRKEVNYFTRYWEKGPDWYRAHFPITRRRLAFEASPNYLFHPFAAIRAEETVPDAKLIVLLREPAARAAIHYDHMVRLGFERRSFTRALESESRLVHDALVRFDKTNMSGSQCSCAILTCLAGTMLINWRDGCHSFRSRISLYCGVRTFSPGPAEALDQSRSSFRSAREGFPASINYSIPAVVQKNTRGRTAGSMPGWAIARLQQENRRLLEVLRRRLPHVGLPPWLTASEQSPRTVPARLAKWRAWDDHVNHDVPWPEAKREPRGAQEEVLVWAAAILGRKRR